MSNKGNWCAHPLLLCSVLGPWAARGNEWDSGEQAAEAAQLAGAVEALIGTWAGVRWHG